MNIYIYMNNVSWTHGHKMNCNYELYLSTLMPHLMPGTHHCIYFILWICDNKQPNALTSPIDGGSCQSIWMLLWQYLPILWLVLFIVINGTVVCVLSYIQCVNNCWMTISAPLWITQKSLLMAFCWEAKVDGTWQLYHRKWNHNGPWLQLHW